VIERNANGQFAKGNRGGPGRPRLDAEQKYLRALRKALPQKDVHAIVEKLVIKAKSGNIQAAKLLLEYAIGKPTQYVETDVSGSLDLVRVIGGVYTPYGNIRRAFLNQDPEMILSGPADTGKTLGLLNKLHVLATKYANASIVICRKQLTDTYGTVLQTFQKRVLHEGAPVEVYGGEKPQWFAYPNGARIWVAGLDKAGKILSAEHDVIYVNQAEEISLADWETLTTRVTGRAGHMPYAQCIGDCNPAYPLHWIKQRAKNGLLTLIESTHRDNPDLYDQATGEITEEGKRRIGRLDNLTGSRLMRLRKGIWSAAEGVVYEELDQLIHVVKRDRSEFGRFVAGVDEGYTNPAVILVFGVDADDRLHLFEEYYRRGVVQEDFVADAVELASKWGIETWYVDPSAKGLKAAMTRAGLSTPMVDNSVNDGIQAVKARLKVAGDGKPRLTIDPDAINTLSEAGAYEWEGGARGPKDRPKKENDHAMDALRYAVMGLNLPAATLAVQENPFYG